jgi:hypothetical protein
MPRSSFRLAGRSPPSTGDLSGADLQRGITGNAAFKGHVAVDPDSDVDENDEDVTTVYGDNAYGTVAFQERRDGAGIDSRCKTQQPTAPGGLFTKDCFVIDLHKSAVT